MSVEKTGDVIRTEGNRCRRGYDFACAELTNPMRTISSTVRTVFPGCPVLPVRVNTEIPKNRIFDVMREINRVVITEPVGRGDIVIPNVLGLHADVIATSNILRQLQTKPQIE